MINIGDACFPFLLVSCNVKASISIRERLSEIFNQLFWNSSYIVSSYQFLLDKSFDIACHWHAIKQILSKIRNANLLFFKKEGFGHSVRADSLDFKILTLTAQGVFPSMVTHCRLSEAITMPSGT